MRTTQSSTYGRVRSWALAVPVLTLLALLVAGSVPSRQAEAAQGGTAPLKLFWNAARGDNFTTATAQGERDALDAGYFFARTEGLVFTSQQPGTVPLKLFWSAARGDNFTTATAKGEQDALDAGYRFARIEGYVYAS